MSDRPAYRSALITGGAGFIGSHLAEKLLGQGVSVTIIDDLSTGRWSNIANLDGRTGFRPIIASAAERPLLEQEVPRHEVVFHLASAVGVKLIIEQPVKTVDIIYQCTDAVLAACSRYRRPVLITSTSEVYGKSTEVPFREDNDVVMGPTEKRRWAYACAKALDEFLGLAHFYETNLPVFVVRLFNTVGPRQTGQYGMVLPTFVRQALTGEALTVYGDGQQRRCFGSVFDVIEGLAAVHDTPAAAGRVINLGSQEEISMIDLAKKVIAMTGSKSTIKMVPYDEAYGAGFDDMRRRVPDITRAREILGWVPTRNLDEIIHSVIEDQKKR
jgi:UDP-glucose 4-epimerase